MTVVRPLRIAIQPRTPHGDPIDGADVHIYYGGTEHRASRTERGYELTLPRPGDYQLRIWRFGRPHGFDHRTLRATLFSVPTAGGAELRHLQSPAEEVGRIVDVREGEDDLDFVIDATIDYLWFTPVGTPPRLGCEVDLLVDGHAGWGAVAEAIRGAQRSVHITTWIYEPDAELERPDPLADPDDRAPFTVQRLLEERAAAGATVRLLPWDAPLIRLPYEARRAGRTPDDRFEVMEEGNPTLVAVLGAGDDPVLGALFNFQIGSQHQKTVIVDGEVGFCGGMNLKQNDWDRRAHDVFDARRCRFERPRSWRERVDGRRARADHPPRHDFVARVRGPAVADLQANFGQRWNRLIAQEAKWSEHASAVPWPDVPDARPGGVPCQVIRTMPGDPPERGILDVHLRALRAARRLIYIEDQYFRSTHVSDAIADAVRTWPELTVIVVTLESQANDWLAGGWSREAYERIARRRPGWELYTLLVARPDERGELVDQEVDNHAKLMIVDDLFLTVGSCNINDRGFEYEGEINIAVTDPALVSATRLDIWREHLADDPALCGDLGDDIAVWMRHAEANRAWRDGLAEAPASAVQPFVPRPGQLRLVGHDVT